MERAVRVHTGGATIGATPPGMILIPSGTFRMGVPMSEALALATRENARYADRIVVMAPDHLQAVSPFFLDRFECTNEQFRRWLDFEGAAPSAAMVQLGAWGRVEKGALVEGLPTGDELRPVRATRFDEAEQCARFAGKRLPTEVEWEHAARRELAPTAYFPWGTGWKAWDGKRCASYASVFEAGSQSGRAIMPTIGSFPSDVSTDGVLDLCGSVAEWTDTPFLAYPGFVAPTIDERGRNPRNPRNWRAEPRFDGNERVVRGGSAWGNELTNHLVARAGQPPGTAAEGVGFRGALSLVAGLDVLREAVASLAPRAAGLSSGIDLGENSIAAQSIHLGESNTGVSTRSHHLAFARITSARRGFNDVRRESLTTPVLVGVLTLSQPALEPELAPGDYVVRFRSRGAAAPSEPRFKLPGDADLLLFEDRMGRLSGFTTVTVDSSAQHPSELTINGGEPGDVARIAFGLRTSDRGVQPGFHFELTFAAGTWEPVPGR